jgi:hypothetical protein
MGKEEIPLPIHPPWDTLTAPSPQYSCSNLLSPAWISVRVGLKGWRQSSEQLRAQFEVSQPWIQIPATCLSPGAPHGIFCSVGVGGSAPSQGCGEDQINKAAQPKGAPKLAPGRGSFSQQNSLGAACLPPHCPEKGLQIIRRIYLLSWRGPVGTSLPSPSCAPWPPSPIPSSSSSTAR